eukprot:13232902-Alexandrium_andersonii.AAC.1
MLFVSAYLTHGIGPKQQNLQLLRSISAYLDLCSLPFIVAADWNMEPAELESSGWIAYHRASVVLPEGVEATCTSGRLLDYF